MQPTAAPAGPFHLPKLKLSPLDTSPPPVPQPQQRKCCFQSRSRTTLSSCKHDDPRTSCKSSGSFSPSVMGSAHWARCPQGPSLLWLASACHSFLRLSDIPLYSWAMCCLPICCNCWVAPLQLLWAVLLWTHVYRYLSPCFQFFGGKSRKSGISGSYGTLCLTSWGSAKHFPKVQF